MIYTEIIAKLVPQAQKRLWIATADIKDMYVEHNGSLVPFLKILAELIGKGVEIRLVHAKEPGQPFREDFDRYPRLHRYLERVLCPRVHFKCIIIDGKQAYFGSANLTGAGMGAKSENRRNFENGILTDDQTLTEPFVRTIRRRLARRKLQKMRQTAILPGLSDNREEFL